MKLALASMAALLVGAPALAQETGFYGTAGYSHLSADDVDLGGVTLRGGLQFNDYLGAEVEGTIGIIDDEQTILGEDVDVELNHAIGAFATAGLPINERGRLFARVGYVNLDIEASAAGASVSEDDSDFAYGIGGEFLLDGRNGVRLGYTAYDFDETIDTFEIAYVRRF